MSKIKINDLNHVSEDFSDNLIQLQDHEQSAIIGGLDPDAGGLAIIGLGIAAAGVTSVTAPAVAAAALVIGVGILLRDLF
ncbi:hypothetical protein [Microseira wollei]|uniref:Bacteriocin n=1 Tax=Microseira wollei NIES-4236 TaxID=2530354 RepID=A0AAV3X9Y6_9CYAN|nr:hypothetical protein [Microseira wollei]GET36132.1 hypothetical protein MiSe_08800 [Microseira wollei NIES-4236]